MPSLRLLFGCLIVFSSQAVLHSFCFVYAFLCVFNCILFLCLHVRAFFQFNKLGYE